MSHNHTLKQNKVNPEPPVSQARQRPFPDCPLMFAEEEKAAAEADAAVAAREATPEVSEEGEIPVDAEELEEISKAQQQQQQAMAKPSQHQHSPPRRGTTDRGRERGPERDRGPAGRDRHALLHPPFTNRKGTSALSMLVLHTASRPNKRWAVKSLVATSRFSSM